MASLRAWWKGERSPEDPFLCFLLSLHYAAYLTFLLLWLHRNAAHLKALEWRVFIEGSLLVPVGGLVLVLLVLAGSGARAAARTATLTGLLAMNAVVLTAAAVAIRIVAPEWHRAAAEPVSLLASRIHAAVALLPLSANALALVALRRLPALRPLARSQKPIVSMIPLTLTLALALLSVSTPPPLHLVAAVLIASALLTLARYRVRIERGAALTRLGDAVVVATIAWLVFDPHLHFDVIHHNWYLGPTNAVMQGGTMLGDVVSAYGVLPIYFLAGVFSLGVVPISYVGLAALVSVLLIIEYVIIYAILRLLRVSMVHAALAAAMVFLVNFIGSHGAVSCFPSLSPLRFGIPYLLLLMAAFRSRNPERARYLKGIESLILAIASVWSLETFGFTAVAYGGVVAFEAAVAWRCGGSWLRPFLVRFSWTALTIGIVQLGFWITVHLQTGAWPDWGSYLAFVRYYTPAGLGESMRSIPKIGGWVAILAIYVGSLLGCAWSLAGMRSRADGGRLAVVLGATGTGMAQFVMYLGMAHPLRFHAVWLPAVFVLAFWGDRLARGLVLAPPRFRQLATCCVYAAALLGALQLVQPLGEWIDHPPDFFARKWPRLQTGVCSSFPECLRRPEVVVPLTRRAESLIEEHVPRGKPIAAFLGNSATTELLFRTGRRHAFPLNAPLQDGLIRANGMAIANSEHELRPGDLIMVSARISWLEQEIVDRICREFECRPVLEAGPITLKRLHAR